MPDVSGLCRLRHYLLTPPHVRGHINTLTEERLPINFDLNTLYIYSKFRYLAVLFQVVIPKNGSVLAYARCTTITQSNFNLNVKWNPSTRSHTNSQIFWLIWPWCWLISPTFSLIHRRHMGNLRYVCRILNGSTGRLKVGVCQAPSHRPLLLCIYPTL